MSDSRPPRKDTRTEPGPRRSGLGFLLPLLLIMLVIYWMMNSNEDRTDFARRGLTLRLYAFESKNGFGLARVVWDAPDHRTEFYEFPATHAPLLPPPPPAPVPAPAPDPSPDAGHPPPLPASTTTAAGTNQDWPKRSHITALGTALTCAQVNDHDLLAFFIADFTTETHQPTRSVGYLYKNFQNSAATQRIFVDTDLLPEVFVAVPENLRPMVGPDNPGDIAPPLIPPGNPSGPASDEPIVDPTVSPAPDNPPLPADPAPPPAPPAPPVVPAVPPTLPLPTESAPPAPPPATPQPPPEGPVVTALPPESAEPAMAASTVVTNSPPHPPEAPPILTEQPVWGFGRIESGAPDRHDRLAVLEIAGPTARIRTISSEKIRITGSSFLLTAVPAANCVHIFWRQTPERGLPSRVINHVVYDGKDFTQEPGLQEAPAGFFATSLYGDKILLTVLNPETASAAADEGDFHGRYALKYAFLDSEPSKGVSAVQPPVLKWETAPGLPVLNDIFELAPIQRLDGRVDSFFLHGESNGQEKLLLVHIPTSPGIGSPWIHHPFLTASPPIIANADFVTLTLLVVLLTVLAGVFLVLWLRPWKWFERPPQDA